MPRNKPRKSQGRIKFDERKLKFRVVKDARKLPDLYSFIPENASENTIEKLDERLRARGIRVKRPFHLVEFQRSYSEFYIETEKPE